MSKARDTSKYPNLGLDSGELSVGNLKLDGNTLSSTDVNGNIILDPNGTGIVSVASNINLASINTGPLSGFRNAIINGSFDSWPYGTSFSFTPAGPSSLTADRWYYYTGGGLGEGTVTKSNYFSTGQPGFGAVLGSFCPDYAIQVTQTVGFTDYGPHISQRINGVRTLSDQTITVSFWADANTDITGSHFTTEQNFGGGSASVWTNVGTSFDITPGWKRYSKTVTLPSIAGKTLGGGSNYLEVYLVFNDNLTFTSTITGFQVEIGDVASDFEHRLSLSALGSPTSDFDFGSNKIINLTDPANAQDAATKNYVDNYTDWTFAPSAINVDLVPDITNTRSLGSADKTWADVHVGPGSLFVNGKEVISDASGIMNFTTSIDQHLRLKTTGTGELTLETASSGKIKLNGDVEVLTGKKIFSSNAGPIQFGEDIAFDPGLGVASNVTVTGNAIITGNLTVQGTTTTVDTDNLLVSDNVITLNYGEAGAGVTLGTSGISIDRGSQTDASIIWDEATDAWKAGLSGAEIRLLTTNDTGTGNNLDADKLDGQHGSYYTNYADTLREIKTIEIGSDPGVSLPSATGTNAIAIGASALTNGNATIAIGQSAQATALDAIAIGDGVTSSGANSISIGTSSDATGASSVALGAAAQATAESAVGIANGANASGIQSISIGASSDATNNNAIAIGTLAQATNAETIAIGDGAQATASGAIAIGYGVINAATNTVKIGADNTNRYITIGGGTLVIPGTTGDEGGELSLGGTAGYPTAIGIDHYQGNLRFYKIGYGAYTFNVNSTGNVWPSWTANAGANLDNTNLTSSNVWKSSITFGATGPNALVCAHVNFGCHAGGAGNIFTRIEVWDATLGGVSLGYRDAVFTHVVNTYYQLVNFWSATNLTVGHSYTIAQGAWKDGTLDGGVSCWSMGTFLSQF